MADRRIRDFNRGLVMALAEALGASRGEADRIEQVVARHASGRHLDAELAEDVVAIVKREIRVGDAEVRRFHMHSHSCGGPMTTAPGDGMHSHTCPDCGPVPVDDHGFPWTNDAAHGGHLGEATRGGSPFVRTRPRHQADSGA